MELTKEYFDQVVASLATKQDSAAMEKRIVNRIDEAQEELARMVANGFTDLQSRFDVQQTVQAHERKLHKIEEALHIKL